MTQEEKAKAYDDLLVKLQKAKVDNDVCDERYCCVINSIVPELKESEDEKTKKMLDIITYKMSQHQPDIFTGEENEWLNDWLEKQDKKDEKILILKDQIESLHAAIKAVKETHRIELEKQGEQKPADKVEPKFHEGEWIIKDNYSAQQVKESDKDSYTLDGSISGIETLPKKYIEKNYHLWTIQDAKGGDVLACESGWTCIFKTLVNDETFSSYCFMDNTKWFCETGCEGHTLKEEFVKAYNGKIYPATKEQRNLLFQKMHEAGYEWDANKKELKRIEQNSAWNEEDLYQIEHALFGTYAVDVTTRLLNKIKSLKTQTTWKPSDEQMDGLNYVVNFLASSERPIENDLCYNILKSLRQQLKKLREE